MVRGGIVSSPASVGGGFRVSNREKSYAEKLVEELAEVRKKERDFEGWRWQASKPGFYRNFLVTKTVKETQVLGFKSMDNDERWDEVPYAVAEEFHSFLAKKRDENYRRGKEIEEELEGLK